MADVTMQAAAEKQVAQAQAIIEQIQGKMRKVVDEFSQSDISREQPFANHANGTRQEANIAGNEPTPSENVSLKETYERIAGDIPA